MTQTAAKKSSVKKVVLPDGTEAYVFNSEQIEIISQIIDDELWKRGLWTRAKRISLIAGGIVFLLLGASDWLPWLSRMITFLTQDMPK